MGTEEEPNEEEPTEEEPTEEEPTKETFEETTEQPVCVKYSLEACESAIADYNLEKGSKDWAFQGDYHIKGCFAYEETDKDGETKTHVFFGTGGSEKQRKEPITDD